MSLVHLNRALSKLGILSRSQATQAILDGRVTVDGRVVLNPAARVDLHRARLDVDGAHAVASAWRTILVNKPRGVVTTRVDPADRTTIYDLFGDQAAGLVPVGRLDMATSGLLILTTDTALADWITDPSNAVPRLYVVTVRGSVTGEEAARLEGGVTDGRDELKAVRVTVRKRSERESHLLVELHEGKNREVRRLCAAIGHEVTRLKRVALGQLTLGELQPGEWRELAREELMARLRWPG